MARVDTPGLVDIEVRFFNQLIFHLWELGQFIDRKEMQKSYRRADIVFSGSAVSIAFTREASSRLILQISCEQLDWQVSSITQICNQFFPFLSTVQDLGINTTQGSSGENNVDDRQWLELFRAFDGVGVFRLASKLATDILRALRPADGEHTTVLPALLILLTPALVSRAALLWEVVESFATPRRLSGHPVLLYASSPISPTVGAKKEMIGTPLAARYLCCGVSFAGLQGLTRHNKSQHMSNAVCTYCSAFEWSRHYLFKKHIQASHSHIAPLVHA